MILESDLISEVMMSQNEIRIQILFIGYFHHAVQSLQQGHRDTSTDCKRRSVRVAQLFGLMGTVRIMLSPRKNECHGEKEGRTNSYSDEEM